MAESGDGRSKDGQFEADREVALDQAKRTISIFIAVLTISVLRSIGGISPTTAARSPVPSQLAESKTGYALVPGKYIVGFQLSGAPKSGVPEQSLRSGAVYTDKSQFITTLKSLSSLGEGERDALSKKVSVGVSRAIQAGLPIDGGSHAQLDEDIVILFALRLIAGRQFERNLPIRGLGFIRPDGLEPNSTEYRIDNNLILELGLSPN